MKKLKGLKVSKQVLKRVAKLYGKKVIKHFNDVDKLEIIVSVLLAML